MLKRFVENKGAFKAIPLQDESFPIFSTNEWDTMAELISILEPIAVATKKVQSRTTSASYIIPLYKALEAKLRRGPLRPNDALQVVRLAIADSLKICIHGWSKN